MESPKSQVEVYEYLTILEGLFVDIQTSYPDLKRSLERDYETIKSRTLAEGPRFLTVVLPRFGKGLERALETRRFTPIPGLQCIRGSSNVPRLFSGMLLRLFDQDGHQVGDSPDLIRILRQLSLMFYKLDMPYKRRDELVVLDKFVANEGRVGIRIENPFLLARAREIVESVLEGFDPKDVRPRHGPGSVATGERGHEKWTFSRLYDDIHQVYPYYEFFCSAGARQLVDRVKEYRSLTRLKSGTAKVVLVPKDSRGPRLISAEPLEYQYIQQGLGRKLVEHLETCKWSRGFVNFTDQSVNQKLAQESSKSRDFCSLDLKDASDLVSLDLVERLFPERVMRYLRGTRTTATKLPDGRVVQLKKFAPMGSCLCFPVEALVFWAVCVAAASLEAGLSWRHVRSAVYVYGDDILVKTPYVYAVMSALYDVGLDVNDQKSFIESNFRESCGMDAYNGVDVTLARVRARFVGERLSGQTVASYVELVNNLFERGYLNAARRVKSRLDSRVRLPYGTDCASGVVYTFDLDGARIHSASEATQKNQASGFEVRWNARYQRNEVRGYRLMTKKVPTPLVGWPRLLRNLTRGEGDQPDTDTVRGAVSLRRAWVNP